MHCNRASLFQSQYQLLVDELTMALAEKNAQIAAADAAKVCDEQWNTACFQASRQYTLC